MFKVLTKKVSDWLKRENSLLPYSVVQELMPSGERHLGLRAIEVEAVVGSVDRHADFDRDFRPKSEHLNPRWLNIESGRTIPPIQVIRVGGVYFVKDGNHRVSVARHRGQAFLEAEVTQVDVRIPIRVGDTLDSLRRKRNLWLPHPVSDLQPLLS
jgi:hypothetical protein